LRATRCKEISISQLGDTGIWNSGCIWITTVCSRQPRSLHTRFPLTKLPYYRTEFNFSHIINELSFGPFFPGLDNPLDATVATTPHNFFKFQYYANIVPTIYTEDSHHLASLSPPKSKNHGNAAQRVSHENEPLGNVDDPNLALFHYSPSTIYTNQYAVTEQSHQIGENMVPGIFVKYDIEPILLLVSEEWGGFLALVVRLINVVSGVLVAGTWCWQLTDWAMEVWGKKSGRERLGFLGTRDEKAV
jgi:endoplasmic reticulum-Golgi intermediate compartment protein 2